MFGKSSGFWEMVLCGLWAGVCVMLFWVRWLVILTFATTHTRNTWRIVYRKWNKNNSYGDPVRTVTAVIKGRSFEITTLRIDKRAMGGMRRSNFWGLVCWCLSAWFYNQCALCRSGREDLAIRWGVDCAIWKKTQSVFVGNLICVFGKIICVFYGFFRFSLYYGLGKLDRKDMARVLGARGLKICPVSGCPKSSLKSCPIRIVLLF